MNANQKLLTAFLHIIVLISLAPSISFASYEGTLDELKKSLSSFSVEGISLGQTPDQLDQTLIQSGYRVKNKSKRPTGTITNYMKRAGKDRFTISVSTGKDGRTVTTIRISIARAGGLNDTKKNRDRIMKVFKGFERSCRTRQNSISCKKFSRTNELLLQMRANRNRVEYRMVNMPSAIAKNRAELERKNQTILKRKENLRKERVRKRTGPSQIVKRLGQPASARVTTNEAPDLKRYIFEGIHLDMSKSAILKIFEKKGYDLQSEGQRGNVSFYKTYIKNKNGTKHINLTFHGDRVQSLNFNTYSTTESYDLEKEVEKIKSALGNPNVGCRISGSKGYTLSMNCSYKWQTKSDDVQLRIGGTQYPNVGNDRFQYYFVRKYSAEHSVAQLDKMKKLTPDHPCNQYDVASTKAVSACLEKMKQARAERTKVIREASREAVGRLGGNRVRRVIVQRYTCGQMAESYRENLKMFGIKGKEADKRIPSCAVFAQLYKEQETFPTVWAGCTGKPRPGDKNFVRKCIEKSIYIEWAKANKVWMQNIDTYTIPCNKLQGLYISNLIAASSKKIGNEYAEFAAREKPQCNVVDSIHADLKDERNQKIAKKRQDQEKMLKDRLYKAYYEKTPEREKAKYSDRERKLMRGGKIAVSANYSAPTAQEVRLAVMRSIIDRVDAKIGKRYAESLRKEYKGPVVAGAKVIYFPLRNVGMHIRFWDVKELSCLKRTSSVGYLCDYLLGSTASTTVGSHHVKSIAGVPIKLVTGALSFSGNIKNHDWFVLTENGWRQPYTKSQKAALRANSGRAKQLIDKRRNKQYDADTPMLEQALHQANDAFYMQGVSLGHEVKVLRYVPYKK